MIAGALPADPNALSTGSGPVDIYSNQIQANLSNDDGGGIRFLQAGGTGGTDQMNVYDNTIVNNVSTHEGGGISLNDAPERADLQQHRDEEPDDGHGRDVERSARARRALHLAQQRPAAGDPARRGAALQRPAAVQQHLLGQPRRHPGRADGERDRPAGDATPVNHWDLGMFDCPTRSRRRARWSSRTRPSTRTTPTPRTAPRTRRWSRRTTCRGVRRLAAEPRRSWTRRWWRWRRRPTSSGTTTSPAAPPPRPATWARRARAASTRPRSTSTTRCVRRSAATTPAPTSSAARHRHRLLPRRPRRRCTSRRSATRTRPASAAPPTTPTSTPGTARRTPATST